MYKSRSVLWEIVFLAAVFFLAFLAGPAPRAAAGEGPSAEASSQQEILALEYRLRLARTSAEDAEGREALYLGMIEECPDTEAAQEALWNLAALYLDGFDDPQEKKAQEVLEYFLNKYPESDWVPQVENRLIWLYEGTDNTERLLQLYEKILQRDMPLSLRLPLALRCAQAWEKAKRPEKAREWYARVIKEAGSKPFPEVATAKARLAKTGKKR